MTQLDLGNASLRGLPGVALVAEETDPAVRGLGLTPESLAERIVATLRRDSIPILERSDALMSARQPMLVVALQSVVMPGSHTYAWHLSLALCQRVGVMERDTTTLAETWRATSSIGITSAPRLQRSVSQTLDGQVAQFVAAWKDAGTGRQPAGR